MMEDNQLRKIMIIGNIMGLQESLNAADPFTFDDLIDRPLHKLVYVQELVLSLYNEAKQLERYIS